MSQDQRDQLKEWSEKKGERSMAALKKQIKEELKSEMKKKGGDDMDSDKSESSADDAVGKEFGRGEAHTRRSGRKSD